MGHQHNTLSTLPLRVRKRDGVEVRFDAAKIESAIQRAGQASGEFGTPEASLLTAQVVKVLAHRYGAERLPDIEGIQDVVEQTLISANHFETARSYIVYREQHKKLRDEHRTLVDVGGSINEYLDRSDWRVAANANQGYSLGGLILNTSGKMIANYWLSHVYPPEIGQAHRDGDIHIHDLDMLSGYCAGWSLRTLLNEGLNGVPGKVEAGPPKHMSSAIGQIVNFLGTLQNEWAGAQAFSSFDTYMAPFVRIDGLDYPHVKQAIQELIYNLNVPSRWGCQCVDEETECLTENGWKRHDQIAPGEKIATIDWRTNQLEYLEPLAITAYDFDGDMYVLRNRTQEQWVTPRHKILRKVFNSDDRWVLEDIETVAELKSPVIVPNAWETTSTLEVDDKLVMLMAWVVAEGNFDFSDGRRRVALYQSTGNPENAAEIEWLLHELDLSWHRYEHTGTYANYPVCRYRLNRDASDFVLGYLERKCVPGFIRTLSVRQIRLFLDTYVKGDGSVEESGRVRIYTNDRENLDALQELCTLAGYGSTVYTRKDSGVHVLNVIRNRDTYIQLIERKPYKGLVWCPTTRNGTFVARRRGKTFVTGNTPFTNLTFDWVCPEDLREQVPVIAGVEQPFTYGDLQTEMDLINRAYIEVMTEGDAKGRIFTFPIPTYNITSDFPWDSENAEHLFEMTAKYGLPYFQNFLNSELSPNMVRSMCCRLQLDLRELLKRGNGLFGSAEQTGSLGVVTINCARLGYTHRGDEAGLLARLDTLLNLARNSLE
ncbi:anaerobic ribonucleoside-triphosphate reductase, partial [Thiocapsa sp.]|uniref:anaerobic ribonucleoside-triphosphate reductase n=1 Tax=Thiocapsa sp. TaxID=2024551 RepID=UPI002C57B474